MTVGLPRHQNHKKNKPLFFICDPVLGIALQQQNRGGGTSPACSGTPVIMETLQLANELPWDKETALVPSPPFYMLCCKPTVPTLGHLKTPGQSFRAVFRAPVLVSGSHGS